MRRRANLRTMRVERKWLGEEVYAALRKMIVQRRLQPGDRLVEGAVAELMGVSRTPVREALQRLEYDGWVNAQPGHSPSVAPITLQEVSETYPLIAVLEGLAVQQALPNLTDADLDRMEALTDAMERHSRRGEVELVVAADADFHAVLHERSRNTRLQRIVGDLRSHMERHEYTYFSEPSVLDGSLIRHRRLVSLLRQGDGRAAEQAIRQQWEVGRREVGEILRHTLPSRLPAEDTQEDEEEVLVGQRTRNRATSSREKGRRGSWDNLGRRE